MIASSVSFNLKCGLRYLQFKAVALDRFQVKHIQRNAVTLKVVFPCWPKHDKPILDVHAVRADQDHFLHLETRFHDYCLLEGYQNPAKNRLTETARATCPTQCHPGVRMEHSQRHSCIEDPHQ